MAVTPAATRVPKAAPAEEAEAASARAAVCVANVTCYAVTYTKLGPECSAGLDVALLPSPPAPPPPPVTAPSLKRAFFNRTALGWYVVRGVDSGGPGRRLHGDKNSTLVDVVCVLEGGGCDAPPQGTATSLDPSTSLVTVYDLTPDTYYTCYARATGPDGARACSAGVRAFTGVEPPTDLRAAVTSNSSLTLSWSLADQGVPVSTYGGVCVAQGLACDAPPEGASPPPALNATSAPVTGLQPGTAYTCYAQAFNALSGPTPVCSTGLPVTTWQLPDPPTGMRALTVNTTTVSFNWTLPAQLGVPTAAVGALCVAAGGTCTSPPVGTVLPPSPGNTVAVIRGLTPGTNYTCYSYATNVAGTSCSTGLPFTTWIAPGPPTGLRALGTNDTAVTFAWSLPAQPGIPPGGVGALCVAAGGTCTDPPVGDVLPPSPGNTVAVLGGLTPGTNYTCYSYVKSAVGTVCSAGLPLTTWQIPGPSTDVTAEPATNASLLVKWAPSSPLGIPAPNYSIFCVEDGGVCSTQAAVGEIKTASASGSVLIGGLSSYTTYSCYVQTSNQASEAAGQAPACSVPASGTTAPTFAFVASGKGVLSKCSVAYQTGELSSCSATGWGWAFPNSVAVYRGYAYVGSSNGVSGNFVILCTVSPGGLLTQCRSTGPFFQEPVGIAVSGGYAYVRNGGGSVLTVCAVSPSTGDLSSCTSLGFGTVGGGGIAVGNMYAYIPDSSCQYNCPVYACALNSTGALVSCEAQYGGFDRPNGITLIDYFGGYAYIANGNDDAVVVCAVSKSTGRLSSCARGSARTQFFPIGIAAWGPYAYTASSADDNGNVLTNVSLCRATGSPPAFGSCSVTGSTFYGPLGIAFA